VRKNQPVDRDTFDSTIRTFRSRVPFRPFTVSLVNGDRLEIDHADAILVRDGVALFAGPGGVPAVFDHEGVAQIVGDLANPTPS
jgi:hypothetical protein